MDEKQSINAATLKSLEQLNKQVAEILQVQRKAISGYDYLNANELAGLLGESIKTIYARVHNRQIPFYKPGGKVLLFKLDEIQEWIKAGRYATMDELRQNV
ncbi:MULTISPECIES: helix-turn-helix transcriptional regulator [unclassified Carboxylicivirga]|uniref:helix-turn-helix transcriptional regulator n=1 Tax=Carboxylicivirga TaxID=1628153 RepID=UPI003D334268